MTFKVDASLNGKLRVEVLSVKGATAYVIMQPNSFNATESRTHGLIENNKLDPQIASGSYSIPSDWRLIISYNTQIWRGDISVKTWVEQYVKTDEQLIRDYQPTGTSYFDTLL